MPRPPLSLSITVSLSSSGFSSESESYEGSESTGDNDDSGIIRFAPEVSFSKLYRKALIAVSLQSPACHTSRAVLSQLPPGHPMPDRV